jgi:putative hydrolase of HD superfamily
MEKLLDFFIEVGKLKRRERKGIAFYGVKNPETTAEHTFRMAIVGWFLGRTEYFNIGKIIKIILIHDLCEVYAGDITPYDGLLPKDKKERFKFVRRWPRLSEKNKKIRYLRKFNKEKKSLQKLIKNLPHKEKDEISNYWQDYEFGNSKEGRFVRQIDRAENLIEAFNCWQRDKNFPTLPWWEHADQVIDDPIILNFLKIIELKELGKRQIKKDHVNENLLTFFSELEKLKDMPRRVWVINDIKNPESVASHVFRTSVMAWILGNKKRLNTERIFKISLIHDICEIYAGDTTPYDYFLKKDANKKKALVKTWRLPDKQKKILQEKKFKKEKIALEKLTKNLSKDLRYEIMHLWLDYEKGLTKEGRFFKQVDRLENFLQAMEYRKKYKKPLQEPWWEWAKEFFDDPIVLEFIEEIAKKFHYKTK